MCHRHRRLPSPLPPRPARQPRQWLHLQDEAGTVLEYFWERTGSTMRYFNILAACASLLLVTGCASQGTAVDHQNLGEIHPGLTTRAEVERHLRQTRRRQHRQ